MRYSLCMLHVFHHLYLFFDYYVATIMIFFIIHSLTE